MFTAPEEALFSDFYPQLLHIAPLPMLFLLSSPPTRRYQTYIITEPQKKEIIEI